MPGQSVRKEAVTNDPQQCGFFVSKEQYRDEARRTDLRTYPERITLSDAPGSEISQSRNTSPQTTIAPWPQDGTRLGVWPVIRPGDVITLLAIREGTSINPEPLVT
jgi:hypothetical protein